MFTCFEFDFDFDVPKVKGCTRKSVAPANNLVKLKSCMLFTIMSRFVYSCIIWMPVLFQNIFCTECTKGLWTKLIFFVWLVVDTFNTEKLLKNSLGLSADKLMLGFLTRE